MAFQSRLASHMLGNSLQHFFTLVRKSRVVEADLFDLISRDTDSTPNGTTKIVKDLNGEDTDLLNYRYQYVTYVYHADLVMIVTKPFEASGNHCEIQSRGGLS